MNGGGSLKKSDDNRCEAVSTHCWRMVINHRGKNDVLILRCLSLEGILNVGMIVVFCEFFFDEAETNYCRLNPTFLRNRGHMCLN